MTDFENNCIFYVLPQPFKAIGYFRPLQHLQKQEAQHTARKNFTDTDGSHEIKVSPLEAVNILQDKGNDDGIRENRKDRCTPLVPAEVARAQRAQQSSD